MHGDIERGFHSPRCIFIYVKPLARTGRIYRAGVSAAFAIYGGVIFGFAPLDV